MTENELLAELVAELSVPPIDPDEITTKMVCDATGMNHSSVRARLEGMVSEGRLTSRRVQLPNGKLATAYRRVA